MEERTCRCCQKAFLPSKFQPAQTACCDPACQRRRVAITTGGRSPPIRCIGRGVWRARSNGARSTPDYWRQLLEQDPARAEGKSTHSARDLFPDFVPLVGGLKLVPRKQGPTASAGPRWT